MDEPEDFDALVEEVLADPVARVAYLANGLQREVGAQIDALRKERKWSIREMGRRLGTKSINNTLRICGRGAEIHSPTLKTLVRAADVFDHDVVVTLVPREKS